MACAISGKMKLLHIYIYNLDIMRIKAKLIENKYLKFKFLLSIEYKLAILVLKLWIPTEFEKLDIW
jgi:hypothetical protein